MCRIIELCAARGVTNFEHNGITIQFGERASETVQDSIVVSEEAQVIPDHAAQNKETLEIEELQEREERLAMLILENPEEYERQIMSGEIGDDISESTENEEV